MPSREGIQEGIDDILVDGIDEDGCFHCETTTIALLKYLHSQGVAIKVEGELPDNGIWHKVEREFEAYCAGRNELIEAGYTAWKPLIKE